MHVIGLTGGIGTGKSTVALFLEEQGATVISADLLGHEVYTPGRPSYHELVDVFGDTIVAPDGAIDRKKLGSIVFADPKELAKLNAIVHPRMKGMMRERLQEMEAEGLTVAVIEAAILLEAGWDDLTDEIWVTVAPPEIAARRVAERSNLPLEQVLERINAQMTNEERTQRADVIIDTSGDMDDTRRQAAERWKELQIRLSTTGRRQ